ncbi:MAG TPA: hypothetical protein VKY74_09795 [Chloroflexia bacterium]|nr:hypothetical protein [Chloroflexia bacterium]
MHAPPARRWVWGLVPLLAAVAYGPVVQLGFLSDDFLGLYVARRAISHPLTWLPSPEGTFYRPVPLFLTWVLGGQAWGLDPLPYHLLGLAVHAGTALALGLWLAETTASWRCGWLAGAIFAVFPLHTETAGWIAAQADGWAAGFGLGGLWLFTAWWRRGGALRYSLALLLYALGVFSKESLLPWLPLLPLAAWYTTPALDGPACRRLGGALLPFAAVLALNLGLRLVVWGTVGGQQAQATHLGGDTIANLGNDLEILLAPLNPAVVGSPVRWAVGLLATLGWLLGLWRYGRRNRRLLLLAAAGLGLAVLPVANLAVNPDTLADNRLLYLTSAAYCAAAAGLIHTALDAAPPAQGAGRALLGALLGLSALACWIQLGPWQTATAQVAAVGAELHGLVPPRPAPYGMIWYVENIPDSYKGAYVLRLGLNWMRYFTAGDVPWVEPVHDARAAPLTSQQGPTFALQFHYDAAAARFRVDYAAGISADPPPAPGPDGQFWDFRPCAPAVLASWQPEAGDRACLADQGLLLRIPAGGDLTSPLLAWPAAPSPARFLRVRTAIRYPPAGAGGPPRQTWAASGPADPGGAGSAQALPVKADGLTHVYWAFLPIAAGRPARLRFSPAPTVGTARLEWVAIDQAP